MATISPPFYLKQGRTQDLIEKKVRILWIDPTSSESRGLGLSGTEPRFCVRRLDMEDKMHKLAKFKAEVDSHPEGSKEREEAKDYLLATTAIKPTTIMVNGKKDQRPVVPLTEFDCVEIGKIGPDGRRSALVFYMTGLVKLHNTAQKNPDSTASAEGLYKKGDKVRTNLDVCVKGDFVLTKKGELAKVVDVRFALGRRHHVTARSAKIDPVPISHLDPQKQQEDMTVEVVGKNNVQDTPMYLCTKLSQRVGNLLQQRLQQRHPGAAGASNATGGEDISPNSKINSNLFEEAAKLAEEDPKGALAVGFNGGRMSVTSRASGHSGTSAFSRASAMTVGSHAFSVAGSATSASGFASANGLGIGGAAHARWAGGGVAEDTRTAAAGMANMTQAMRAAEQMKQFGTGTFRKFGVDANVRFYGNW